MYFLVIYCHKTDNSLILSAVQFYAYKLYVLKSTGIIKNYGSTS